MHETVDSETVVINLASGNYYSIAGSGADLWSRLVAGETPEESAAALATVHGGDAARIASAIRTFHKQLLESRSSRTSARICWPIRCTMFDAGPDGRFYPRNNDRRAGARIAAVP